MRKASDFQDTSDLFFTRAAQRGLMYRAAEDEVVGGRVITLDGRELLQFGSGSYLGLETDARLKEAAIDAIHRYGTQFPSSRAYVSAPLYPEAEALLGDIFGTPVLLAASSTLAHTAAIPVLIGEGDAVILDQQVHTTVQMAVNHVRVLGVTVEMIRHNRLDKLEERLDALRRTHRRVWYMADGVYSMFGDRAPVSELIALLNRYEQFRVYIDDAHGMSWTGQHGHGFVLEQGPLHPQMVMATSLAKSFASGGGVIVTSDAEQRRKIRTIGSSLVFSGPLQPANLGALIASAHIHLSPEISERQSALLERLQYCNRRCRELGLPLVSEADVPIRFIGMGLSKVAYEVAERLMKDGFYSNVAVFPAVPMQRAGLRFTLTLHQSLDDIERFLQAVARHLPEALADEGSSIEEVRQTFRLPTVLENTPPRSAIALVANTASPGLRLEHVTTITALSPEEWDGMFGTLGGFTWEGLRVLETTFQGNDRPEDNWLFHYYIVRNEAGQILAATFFTDGLWKDDMLSPAAVSREVELQRREDPYKLTSRSFAMGTLLTEGNHLYLDRDGDWRSALKLVLRAVRLDHEASGATNLVLRDLPSDDAELDTLLIDEGFARFAMPHSMELELNWENDEEHLARLSYKARTFLKREVLPWDAAYDVSVFGQKGIQPDAADLNRFYDLYEQVKARAYEMNTFALPKTFFQQVLASPQWEVLALRLRPEAGGEPNAPIVGIAASFVGVEQYVPLLVGMDDRYIASNGLYRQLTRHIIQRARLLGLRRIHQGFGAELEKRRFGAQPYQRNVYFQTTDLYRLEQLGQLMMVGRSANSVR